MRSAVMRFPGGRKKALTLSYDDGVEQDIYLLKLMAKYGVKGTFNINSGLYADDGTVYEKGTIHRRMSLKQCLELYCTPLAEVAVHGYSHPDLEKLPSALIMDEVIHDRKNLEEQFGTIIRGMAYPYGTFSDTAAEILRLAGIAYSRTVISNYNFSMPKDWLRLQATCHHNDPKLMELTEEFLNRNAGGDPLLFYLWGHSYEFDANNNWNVIEEFLKRMSDHDDIWYATNIEIYDYTKAYESLIFSVNGERICNPSAITVCFEIDGKNIEIQPGKTILITK